MRQTLDIKDGSFVGSSMFRGSAGYVEGVFFEILYSLLLAVLP